jgi:putative ABC transport system substrate-binding protein
VAGGATAWPLAAQAQRREKPVIGFFSLSSAEESEDRVRAFVRGLNETGFDPSKNVVIDYQWADNQYNK